MEGISNRTSERMTTTAGGDSASHQERGRKMSDLETIETREEVPLSAIQVRKQINLIQEIMKDAMIKGEHYGTIPGCGDKPTLLKAGAEKLNLTFRMDPDIEIEVTNLGEGHREYQVKCVLYSINSRKRLGAGVGSASTMETKWRYRSGPVDFIGKPVPKEYWDSRKPELLGGKGFVVKKNPDNGQWEIARQGERVEHDNPADYYNTCLKMAKKRALVDAVLTVTAASDIFTQDIEEMAENGVIDVKSETSKKTSTVQPAPQTNGSAQSADELANPNQLKAINTILTKMEITDDMERHQTVAVIVGLKEVPASLSTLTKPQASKAIEGLQAEYDKWVKEKK